MALPSHHDLVRIQVLQSQAKVSAGPRVEFSTVLGSCVATCLYDPAIELGGMNHFLLSEPISSSLSPADEHYGVYLMEVLINEMLQHGSDKRRLKARIYGGANMHPGMARIGTMNADFARRFLASEGIPLMHEDLGGTNARRIDFRPASGQVRCRSVPSAMAPQPDRTARSTASGELELF